MEDGGIERCSEPMEPQTETCKTERRPRVKLRGTFVQSVLEGLAEGSDTFLSFKVNVAQSANEEKMNLKYRVHSIVRHFAKIAAESREEWQ